MSELSAPIKSAVADVLAKASADPEKIAEVFETTCASLSMIISVMAKGNPALMNELCEGASQYIFERSTGFQKFGAFMAKGASSV